VQLHAKTGITRHHRFGASSTFSRFSLSSVCWRSESHAQLHEYSIAFLNAYNFAKRLKTLADLTSLSVRLFMPAKGTSPLYI